MIKELRALAAVTHPRCVKLLAVYESAESLFVVVNLFKGSDLLFRMLTQDCT